MMRALGLLTVGIALLSASLHAEEAKPIHRLYSEDLSRDGLQMDYMLVSDRPLSVLDVETKEVQEKLITIHRSMELGDSDSLLPFTREKYHDGWESVSSITKLYLADARSLSNSTHSKGFSSASLWFHSLAKSVSYDEVGKALTARDTRPAIDLAPLHFNDELIRQSASPTQEFLVLSGEECEYSPSADSVTYQVERRGNKLVRIASGFTQFEGHRVPTLIEQIEINERGEMREYTAFRDIKYSRPSEAEIQAALDKFHRDFENAGTRIESTIGATPPQLQNTSGSATP